MFVGDDSGKIEVYSNDNLGDMHTNLDTQKDSVINKIMKSADNTKLYALTDSGIYAFDISNMPPGGGTIKTTNFFSFSDNLQSNDMEFTSTSPGMLYVDHGLAIYGFVLNDLTKKLWDTSSVILPNTMSPLTGSITSHILSADGSTIYFGTSDSLVYSYKTILSGVNSNSFYNIDSN